MKIIVIGACNIDVVGKSDQTYVQRTSNIGQVAIGVGGVGRNIAHRLAKLGDEVELITVIPETFFGELIEASLFRSNIGFMHVIKGDFEDSFYLSLEDNTGEMIGAINQMDSVNQLTPERVRDALANIMPCDMIVADANLSLDTLTMLAEFKGMTPLAVEAVSIQKVKKITGILSEIDLLKVNEMEARALVNNEAALSPNELVSDLLRLGVKEVHMTRGEKGILVGKNNEVIKFPVEKVREIHSVNKAGDEYFAGIIHSYLAGFELEDQIEFAQKLVVKKLMGEE